MTFRTPVGYSNLWATRDLGWAGPLARLIYDMCLSWILLRSATSEETQGDKYSKMENK